MEFHDVVRRRRMIRNYAPDPVAPAVLDKILDNALRAPSAGFSQGWGFLVLDQPDEVSLFWASTSPDPGADNAWLRGMRSAPVLIVPFAHKAAYLARYAEVDKGWSDQDEARWPIPYWYTDTAMAALLILLTATDEGLGACFFGVPGDKHQALREAFDVPADHTPIGAITIGHRADDPGSRGSAARSRRMDVVHRGRWER